MTYLDALTENTEAVLALLDSRLECIARRRAASKSQDECFYLFREKNAVNDLKDGVLIYLASHYERLERARP